MSTEGESAKLPIVGEETGTISRRKFLQILGSGSVAGAVGCTDRTTQSIFPDVKGDAEKIPGIAVWYSSTCTECSAGCGIQVRTRENRAVKLEGNPDSPINKGGLCALGQSALQNHYDPDRVRQPLKKSVDANGKANFVPVSWDEAFATVTGALKDSGKKAFVTGEQSGSLETLTKAFSDAFSITRVSYDVTQPVAVAKAGELVFGSYGVPTYTMDKAEVVVNFGADFLETWLSPCELARSWSDGRRSEVPTRFVHIEPRLSLTGASADTWLAAKPGSELQIALALLKLVLENGRGAQLDSATLSQIKNLVSGVSVEKVSEQSGVPVAKILLVARWLNEAKYSLVLSGGSAASTEQALSLSVVTNLLNLVLDNVGTTVNVTQLRKPQSSLSALAALTKDIDAGKIKTLFVYGANPAFTLPAGYRFDQTAMKKVSLVVSFSSHLDETAQLADIILPSSSFLESWGDAQPRTGVYGIVQPTMTPVFDTKSIGDMLLTLADKAGNTTVGGGSKDFLSYVKSQWQKLFSASGVGGDFESFWKACVERGGYFPESSVTPVTSSKIKVAPAAFQIATGVAVKSDAPVLYPYFSVKSFDGRAANRPWLQELPDPITTVAWDSWVEVNPENAKEFGLAQGDLVTLRNEHGEVNLPAIITEHVLPGVYAVPIGQGHTSFGRYADKVKGGNILNLIPPATDRALKNSGDQVALLSAEFTVFKGRGKAEQFVVTQETFDQEKRELAKTTFIGATAQAAAHNGGGHEAHGGGEGHGHGEAHAEGHEGGHHEVKQMYKQREHPLYDWALSVDLSVCTGCAACVVACYAENNIPVVGRKLCYQGREMSWIRIERYEAEGPSEELQVSFLPMMCQQCHNAPCEPVCPVYATYHNDEGLNVMVYNRCVGTRYCSNNCSYKVRRFNFTDIDVPVPLSWQLNPDVTKRTMGVMEKCTFCVQRILEGKDRAKDEGRLVADGEIQPACVQSCPTQALVFGNLKDPNSKVSKMAHKERAYKVLDHHINTQPGVSYLERVKYPAEV